MYIYGIWASSKVAVPEYIAVGFGSSPYLNVYPWTTGSGFGTKYTNPATLPTSTARDIDFRTGNTVIGLIGSSGGNPLQAYPWSASGFGTKYTDDNPGESFQFSPDGLAVAAGLYATSSNPRLRAVAFTLASGFGTSYASPSVSSFVNGNHAAFSKAGTTVNTALAADPWISSYAFTTASGFGTKYTSPVGAFSSGQATFGNFRVGDTDYAASGTGVPHVVVYPWTTGTGFGTKYSDPATLPAGSGQEVNFSPAGNDIAVAHTSSPSISVYPFTTGTGFGSKYSNPASGVTGNGTSVSFSRSGNNIAVASTTTPFIHVYPWTTGTGFGSKYANPATLPSSTSNSVAFSK